MNIFFREMRANRNSLIIWCIGVFFMVASGMSKYAAYAAAGQSMNEILSQIPPSIKVVLGMGSFDLTKVSGFYGMMFLYVVIMATIHAAILGANIIAKEERDKTTEFLFAKPVSRDKVITMKIAAALTNIIVLNIITLLSSIALMSKYSNGEPLVSEIGKLMLGMFMLQLMFMSIGTGIAAISKRPNAAASGATGILLVAFILSILVDLNQKLGFLKYLTPFKYFDAKNILSHGFEPLFVILSLVIIAILIIATYGFYKKRDLNV